MRHTVRVVCFLVSCITLSIACYDLYKNFPLLRTFLETYFKEYNEWLERIFHEQVTVWMGIIFYVAWPLQFVLDTLKSSEMFMHVLNGAIYPLIYLGQSFFALMKLLVDLLWPIKALMSLIVRYSLSLVWNMLCLPYTLLSIIYYCLREGVSVIKGMSSSLGSARELAAHAPTASDTQEAISMIAYITQLCIYYSQSITNKVLRACKAVYDFIVYVGCEIGKHNYTIQVYLYEKAWHYWFATRDWIRAKVTRQRLKIAWKTVKYLCYAFILFFVVHVIIVMLRERFELEGCALCIEKEVDKISALMQT